MDSIDELTKEKDSLKSISDDGIEFELSKKEEELSRKVHLCREQIFEMLEIEDIF